MQPSFLPDTKTWHAYVTELLEKHGFRAAALNGDMTQQLVSKP